MIPTARLHINFTEAPINSLSPRNLRGAIVKVFPDKPLLHQHKEEGFVYRYPLIHYRCTRHQAALVGFHEGGRLLAKLPLLNKELYLGNKKTVIEGIETAFSMEKIDIVNKLIRYRFITPWLSLNQEIFQLYKDMDKVKQAYERDRLAVANLLMALRGLRVQATEQIYAAFQLRRVVSCKYKDQTFMGFLGTLSTNIDMPDDIAIGKAVSHGYGWLKRN